MENNSVAVIPQNPFLNQKEQDGQVTIHNGNTSLDPLTRASLDSQIVTAKRFPRNPPAILDKCIFMATLDEETAYSCGYSLTKRDKDGNSNAIEGPSVHLAKTIAQLYGNITFSSSCKDATGKYVIATATAYDCENNIQSTREAQRSITYKNGGRYSDDMVAVVTMAAQSIALRNAIFDIIPRGIVNKVYKASINFLRGQLSTEQKLTQNRNRGIEKLITMGVSEAEILEALGRGTRTAVTVDDVIKLGQWVNAILNKDSKISDIFGKPESNTIPHSKALDALTATEAVPEVSNTIPTEKEGVDTQTGEMFNTTNKKTNGK